MLLPIEFTYFQPKTLEDVCSLLDKKTGNIRIMAGGTDLVLAMKREEDHPKTVISVTEIPELKVMSLENDQLILGAASTFTDIKNNPLVALHAPALAQAARQVGAPQIRNLGTLGGNIATASSAGDSLPALVAHRAEAVIVSKRGERRVSVESLLSDAKQGLQANEIIKYLMIKTWPTPPRGAFIKLGRRNALAKSRMSIAISVHENSGTIDEANVALGAVGLYPIRVNDAEKAIIEGNLRTETWERIASMCEEAIRKSIAGRSTMPYKAYAIHGLVMEALEQVTK